MNLEISHLTFIVKDLAKASLFFEKIFDAKEVYSSGEETFSIAKEKFYLISDKIWVCIMEGEASLEKTYNHIAFQIQEEEIETYMKRINEIEVEIKLGRERIQGEGDSIYFYDFDKHLFELHTGTLEKRLDSYKKNKITEKLP